ncbi:MAG: hypothetical protein WCK09_01430 [Bacteroidota bacterium]
MKKIILLLSECMLISLMGFTQKITADKVPAQVKQAFSAKFTTATDIKYEMDLKKDKQGFEVQFSPKGDLLKKTPLKKETDDKD